MNFDFTWATRPVLGWLLQFHVQGALLGKAGRGMDVLELEVKVKALRG